MSRSPWKLTRDPLHRGDRSQGVSLPCPQASRSIVRHVLYLEGYGRETPYLSATEERDVALRFAGSEGRTYMAHPQQWAPLRVSHRPRKELLQLLRGKGKGDAEWPYAFEVMRARQYVEEAQEHLADFSELSEIGTQNLVALVNQVFYPA
jgi:hypothetical protein